MENTPYFDNAATTMPKPREVIRAVAHAMESFGNPSRGAYSASLDGLRCLASAREAVAGYYGVRAEGVVFTPNATAALNLAIGGIKGHIVTTAAEHNSVLRPVHRRGNYTLVPVDRVGRLDMDRLEQALRPDSEAILLTHASNLTGNVYDLDAAAELARRRGVRLMVDAAQTAGLIPVDIERLGIAALCFSGHKSFYGPPGIGGLCLGDGFLPPPMVVGGSGSDSLSLSHPADLPDALEAGTQNAPAAAGLRAGIAYMERLDGRVFTEADRLARLFVRAVRAVPGVDLYGDLDAPVRTPVVALNLRGMDCALVADRLAREYDIAVRAGIHCAPRMHRSLGTEGIGAVRFSFSHRNTDREVELTVDALSHLAQEARS